MQAEHPLAKWLKDKGERASSFAVRAKTTAATISRVINYKTRPTAALSDRIIEAAGGELTYDDLMRRPVALATPGSTITEAAP